MLAAAVDLLDEAPDAPLTMKRLSTRLGIAPMTLYGYVANKEELLEGVAAIVFDGIFADIPADAPWDEQLRAQTLRIHSVVLRHPGLARALRAHRSPNPALFRVREDMLATLARAGFTPPAALDAMGILTAYAQGFAAVQAATLATEELRDRIQRLPKEEFPLLHRSAADYGGHISDRSFNHGLELVLAGLRRELKELG